MELRIHGFVRYSRANGPGARAVLWTQGCSLGCPGCFNPETHSFQGGQAVEVDLLFDQIRSLEESIEGLTVSGGEPFQQLPILNALLRRVRRETRLSVIVFTGLSWSEITRADAALEANERSAQPHPEARFEILELVDVLIAGRYEAQSRLAHGLRGSAGKTIHLLTSRYAPSELEAVPPAEVVIGPAGEMVLSGIDPVAT